MSQIMKEEERPLIVKSTNFRNSAKLDPKNHNEPPTDRQINYIRKLKLECSITKAIPLPKNRKIASDIIGALLKRLGN